MNISRQVVVYSIINLQDLLTGVCTVEVADDDERVDVSVGSVDEVEDGNRVMVDVGEEIEDESVVVEKSAVLKVGLELEVVGGGLDVDKVVKEEDDDDEDNDDDNDDEDVVKVEVVDIVVDEVVDEVDEDDWSLCEKSAKPHVLESILTGPNTIYRRLLSHRGGRLHILELFGKTMGLLPRWHNVTPYRSWNNSVDAPSLKPPPVWVGSLMSIYCFHFLTFALPLGTLSFARRIIIIVFVGLIVRLAFLLVFRWRRFLIAILSFDT